MLRRRCARLRLPLIRRLPSAFAEYGGGARENLGPAVRISFDAAIMLNLRENLPHSDEITSLYQVAAAPPQPTPIRRAAACGGVAPAARGPGAAAPSRACAGAGCRGAALAVCACPRGRARCPPPGGLRAPLPAAPQSGAAAGLCGASAAAAASRSVPRGARPPAPLPRRCAVRACSSSGCCAALRPRSPSFCAGAPRFAPPLPGLGPPRWSLRSLRGVLAPLLPRRAAACGGVARRPGGGGAVPPRPLVPASLRPRGLRRVVPAPRRPAPRGARLGAAPPCQGPAAAGPGGRAAAGGLLAAAAAAAFVALCAPPRGVGVPPLRRRFFRGCCGALLSRAARRGLASPALLSALPSAAASCALTAALLPRGLFAPPAHFVVQGEVESQGVTRSTTYSAGLLLDIQNKLRFGKTRIILPNYLCILSIDTAPCFCYAHIRN